MRKEIIINSAINEVRVATTEDGHLAEFLIEYPEKEKLLGNVYYGKVSKINTGINAAFVDIGLHQDAFLHFSDVDDTNLYNNFDADEDEEIDEVDIAPSGVSATHDGIGEVTKQFATFFTKRSGEVAINLQEGQEILVQVVREPYAHKGMKVTTKIAIPGRFVVLLPFEQMVGISRKIRNDVERKRLRKLARRTLPKGFGCIIRTAAVGKSEEELINDYNNLLASWKATEDNILLARKRSNPALVYQDMLLADSVIRDYFKKDISRAIIDSSKLYNSVISYLSRADQSMVKKVEYYNGITPIFAALGIDKELDLIGKRSIGLSNGGDIVFDRTEALTVIDVNTGRSTETNHEKNALMTNMEAAREIARQLRLRDIGGIIIVDFIDMQNEQYRKKLFHEMLNAIRSDKAKVVIYPLTQLGLMQITRQRINQNIVEKISAVCPTCHGKGRVASYSTIINAIEKWLKSFTQKNNEFLLTLLVHPEIAEYLTEGAFSIVSRLMIKYFVKIKVLQSDSLTIEQFRVISERRQKDITNVTN